MKSVNPTYNFFLLVSFIYLVSICLHLYFAPPFEYRYYMGHVIKIRHRHSAALSSNFDRKKTQDGRKLQSFQESSKKFPTLLQDD